MCGLCCGLSSSSSISLLSSNSCEGSRGLVSVEVEKEAGSGEGDRGEALGSRLRDDLGGECLVEDDAIDCSISFTSGKCCKIKKKKGNL